MAECRRSSAVKIYGNTPLAERLGAFQKNGNQEDQKSCHVPSKSHPHVNDLNYGRPVAGSKTDKRGKAAAAHVGREVVELCRLIKEYGQPQGDGTVEITFKELFDMYQVISNKVVGVLLRARKHGLVTFEGEMLFQRRDDNVIVTLIVDPDEIQNSEDSTACVRTGAH